MLFGHDANMGRAAKERYLKIPPPYSNWPTTFACYALHGVSVRPHSQDSHEMQVEEPVQGPSHSGGTGTMVGMELSASYERLDFALA